MPSTNFARLRRVAEVTKGVTPATPVMQYASILGHGLKPTDPFGRSEQITGDRGIVEHQRLGVSAAGDIRSGLSGGWHDWMFELALNDRFAAGVEAFNVTADSTITQVTLSTQTILASGAWVPGMLVESSDFGVAGNNKQFRAQAGSGAGTLIAPAATLTADEAAPPARARVLYLGVEGVSGDLVTAADGITSTALDFTLFPIPVDAAVWISGYDDATVDTFATVSAVAAGKLTLKDLPASWTAGLGAGKTVRIRIGEPIEAGDETLTESVESFNSRTSPVAYERFTAVAANTLSLPLELNAVPIVTAQVLAFLSGVSETPLAASTQDPFSGQTNRPMKTGNNLARLSLGTSALATAACAQQLTFDINNNLTPVGCLAHDAAVDYNPGDFEIVMPGQFRYADKSLLEKYHLGDSFSPFTVIFRAGWAYTIKVHNAILTDAGAPVPARNDEHINDVRFEASKHPVSGKIVTINRFRRFLS